ncbi:MAG TPA: GNAT family N-acetyltransferase [Terriglobia bacterium]|nr:GNAT family N-acetyltransferase [Terriglobia bacterium]
MIPADDLSAAALPPGYAIAPMTRTEADTLGVWAAEEGWNPGLADIDVAWGFDPEAFIALRKEGALAGGATIITYGDAAGFLGLFIMRRDLRGQGLGRILWQELLRRQQARLKPAAPIGLDGVFDMAPFYAADGFQMLYRDLRYEGTASGIADAAAVPLGEIGRDELDAYDAAVSGIARAGFMHRWLAVPGGKGFAFRQSNGSLAGYGFARPCRSGYKIGPLYADDATVAARLLETLLAAIAGAPVALDVPEPNAAALALVEKRGWRQSFGCARMARGTASTSETGRIFGVTSFEFG